MSDEFFANTVIHITPADKEFCVIGEAIQYRSDLTPDRHNKLLPFTTNY